MRHSCNRLLPSCRVMFALILVVGVTACATDSPHRKTVAGVGAGAAIGAIIGAVVGGEDGAAIGALIGGAVGGGIGAKLDADDRKKRQYAMDVVAGRDVGDQVAWATPEKQTAGSVVKLGNVFEVDGQQCMLVEETVTIKGKPTRVEDTMCRDPHGEWSIAAI